MQASKKNLRKKANGKKQTSPSLNLVLKRLDKIDQRFDTLDQKVGAVDQKVDAFRQETAAEFKAVHEETAQGFANMEQRTAAEFKAVRGEMAQGFDAVRGEMVQGFDAMREEFNTKLEKVSDGAYEHYLRIENKRQAEVAEYQENQRRLLTSYDNAAKNYERFTNDRDYLDAQQQDLKKDIELLKKRDMEKAAAIEKIEQQRKAA